MINYGTIGVNIMANMTLAEAQTQLTQVNIAIQDIIAGKRVNELKIGNAEFANWYKFTDITFDNLQTYRRELLVIIDSYAVSITPTFRTNACIPLVVRKGDV